MVIKATSLRQNLYQLLDEVLATGQPIVVERKGRRLHIIPEGQTSKLERLESHSSINGAPEDLLNLDWSEYWSEAAKKPKRKKKS